MNSTRLIFFVIIICFSLSTLQSCTEQKEYKMDRDKLTLVIRDMNLIELMTENRPLEIKDSLRQLNLNRMCSIHQTNISDLEHDLKLISTDFVMLDSIYSHIILMDTTSNTKTNINTPPK